MRKFLDQAYQEHLKGSGERSPLAENALPPSSIFATIGFASSTYKSRRVRGDISSFSFTFLSNSFTFSSISSLAFSDILTERMFLDPPPLTPDLLMTDNHLNPIFLQRNSVSFEYHLSRSIPADYRLISPFLYSSVYSANPYL